MFSPVIAERWNINQAINRIIKTPNDILADAIKLHLKIRNPELKADTELGIHQDVYSCKKRWHIILSFSPTEFARS